MKVVKVRRRRAISFLFLGFVLILLLNGVGQDRQDVMTDASSMAVRGLSENMGDIGSAPDEARASTQALPPGFAQEVMSFNNASYDQVRVDSNNTVVGFRARGSPETTFKNLSEQLNEKGWVATNKGVQGAFFKKGGKYTWLYVWCIQVAQYCSVVVQCTPPERSE